MAKKKPENIPNYVAAVAVVCAFAVLVLTSMPRAGTGTESQTPMASAVNSVVVYSNGMALVSAAGSAEVPFSGNVRVRIENFTNVAELETLKVETSDGSVHWVKRYIEEKTIVEKSERYLSFDELLNRSYGKEVKVKLDGEEVSGKLLWVSDGKIGVETPTGLLVVSSGLKNVMLEAGDTKFADERNVTKNEWGLEIYLGATNAGTHRLLLSYLSSGASWSPNYDFEMPSSRQGNARLTAYGLVSNHAGEDWKNAVLKLAVGSPNFVRSGVRPYYNYDYSAGYAKGMNVALESAPSAAPSFSGEDVGMQYVYTLSEPATILKGESANLRMFRSDVGYARQNVWEGYGPVWQSLKIKNSAGKPIASGVMRIYDAGNFAGEGEVKYAGEGKEANVKYAVLPQIEVKKESNQTTEKPYPDRRETTYSIAMNVESSLKEAAPLILRDYLPYGDKVEVVSTSAPVQMLGNNQAEWEVEVPAGGKMSVSYLVKVTNFFQQPVYYGHGIAGAGVEAGAVAEGG